MFEIVPVVELVLGNFGEIDYGNQNTVRHDPLPCVPRHYSRASSRLHSKTLVRLGPVRVIASIWSQPRVRLSPDSGHRGRTVHSTRSAKLRHTQSTGTKGGLNTVVEGSAGAPSCLNV